MQASLTIEPLSLAHLDELAEVLRHPAVYEHLGGRVPDSGTFRRGLACALAGPGPGASGQVWLNFLARLPETGEMLGRLEATLHDGLAEVAFLFGPHHWGKGHAREGLEWLHTHLEAAYGIRSCWATTVPANLRCQALLARSGYLPAREPFPRLLSYDEGDLVFRRPRKD